MSLDLLDRPSTTPPSTEAQEYPIYPCGTFAPGHVHDPCQHSVLVVTCCSCAGCAQAVWCCGDHTEPDSYFWWEAHKIAERWDPWMRHPYALVLYALVLVFLLASGIVFDVLKLLWMLSELAALFVILLVSVLLH